MKLDEVSTPPVKPGELVQHTADVFVRALMAHEVEFIFLNPGTDTAPVQEALARLATDGLPAPRVVLCPHEAVALAAAHAYYAVTGRPQVVMVHVDVGTQNLGAMLHNAARADAGVVIVAGRTPRTTHGEQTGGRDLVVHWQQDVPDQVGIVRSYVKWAGEIYEAQTVGRLVNRAFQIAASAPAGPVYLTVAREVLMTPAPGEVDMPAVARFGCPAPAAPNPDALRVAAGILAQSRRPVITTTRLGRRPAAVAELVRLAELLHAPVIDRRERMNFPSTHPLYISDAREAQLSLREADAVLMVDSNVPWVPLRACPPEQAKIIQIDADPVKVSMPGWSFPVDVCIQADPLISLRQLNQVLADLGGANGPTAWQERRTAPAVRLPDRMRKEQTYPADMPLPPEAVIAALNTFLDDHDIVVEEAVTNTDVLRKGLRRTRAGTLFQAGGSGLGWALGAAVGAKLAAPTTRVVAVVGDGTLLFSSPTAALWTARNANAPVLVLVLKNGGYAASRRPVFELYPHGASQTMGDVVGTRFPNAPDFAKLAEACGAEGEEVYDARQLDRALQRAFEAIERGTSALIAVHITSPWL